MSTLRIIILGAMALSVFFFLTQYDPKVLDSMPSEFWIVTTALVTLLANNMSDKSK